MLNYRVFDATGTLVGEYGLLQEAADSWLRSTGGLGTIFTTGEVDLTDAVRERYHENPPAAKSFWQRLRLPAKDSATFKAILVFIYTNAAGIVAWLTNPDVVAAVSHYAPWLLPLFGLTAATLALLVGFGRSDVKNY